MFVAFPPPGPSRGTFSWACLFVLVDVGALVPPAVRVGHAGHEEYPALTWHIRSGDWDRLAARSGRGNYKKEGKRKTGRGLVGGLVRKGEGEEGKREETRVTIYGM